MSTLVRKINKTDEKELKKIIRKLLLSCMRDVNREKILDTKEKEDRKKLKEAEREYKTFNIRQSFDDMFSIWGGLEDTDYPMILKNNKDKAETQSVIG